MDRRGYTAETTWGTLLPEIVPGRIATKPRKQGLGSGVYDQEGALRTHKVAAILDQLGDRQDAVIWEAPRSQQQAGLIVQCGPNVNLGNIKPPDVLGVEALRRGLRFDTFRHFGQQLEPKALIHE